MISDKLFAILNKRVYSYLLSKRKTSSITSEKKYEKRL